MRELTKEESEAIRLQMLYSIGNGWSWHAYKRIGPEKIIEMELEMWDELLPPAVDLLFQMMEPEGTPVEQVKHVLNQITKINGYVPKYLEKSDTSLRWEYAVCPNWDSLVMLNYEDYLAMDGKPTKVSCIHGCTRIHEIYFRKIDRGIKLEHFELRPNGDETCVFQASLGE